MNKKNRKLVFSVTMNDCEMQTFTVGGAGGQRRDHTNTGVRLIHHASGARGESREERSQEQNKRAAFKRMAESGTFQMWLNRKLADGPSPEERVEKDMQPEKPRNRIPHQVRMGQAVSEEDRKDVLVQSLIERFDWGTPDPKEIIPCNKGGWDHQPLNSTVCPYKNCWVEVCGTCNEIQGGGGPLACPCDHTRGWKAKYIDGMGKPHPAIKPKKSQSHTKLPRRRREIKEFEQTISEWHCSMR